MTNNTNYPTEKGVSKHGKKKKVIKTKSKFSKEEKCLNYLRELLKEKNKELDDADEIQKNDRLFQKICRSLQITTSTSISQISKQKTYDVFISYRRSNGSHLASLLYLYLTNRNLKVFLDVESLEGGKFEDEIWKSIR